MEKKQYTGVRPTPNGKGIRLRNTVLQKTFTHTLYQSPTPENLLKASQLREERQRLMQLGYDPYTFSPSIEGAAPEDILEALGRMFQSARKRRADYALTPDQELRLIRRAMGKCELTGISFSLNRLESKRAPFGPSLDRIKSSEGYHYHNVRIICTAANYAMNEWGESVLNAIARGYLSHRMQESVDSGVDSNVTDEKQEEE